MLKKIIKFIVGLILILGIALGAIFFYVKGHKEEVVNFVINTISEKHNGTVSFDDVTLRSWGNFTNPAFYVKNMVLLDSSDSKITRFEARKVYLNLTVRSLLKEKIQVKSVRIENANYSSVITKEDLAALTANKDSLPKENRVSEIFKPYKMSFDIENFTFDIQNIPRHKRIKFTINEISSNLLVGPDKITSSMDLDAHITQLGFNLEKGSYLKDSKIEGTMYPEIDLANNKIHIPSFDLSIKDQIFKLTADFDTSRQSSFLFELVNEETEYEPTVSLLSDHIQFKLNKYKIDRAFSTHTTLQGSFAPFSNPLVHVKFNSVENSALIIDRFDLDNLSFTGSFTNRIYDDERAKTEDKKDSKLKFSSVTGIYKETKFELNNGMLISTPKDKALIKGSLKVDGIPENLVSLTNDAIFTLKGGHFNLMAELEGDATSAADLLTQSNITLKVINTDIFDIEDELSIPVKQLNINLKKNRAVLEILELPLGSSDHLKIYGEASHFSSLLNKDAKVSAKTSLRLRSTKLRWEDFVNIFENPNKGPKEKVKKSSFVLKRLLQKIYLKFDPSIAVDIEEFGYKSFQLTNFSTGLTFSDVNHLNLNNTAFEIREGAVKLNAALDFEQAEQIIIDAEVDVTGSPEILNDIFKSDTFFFNGGRFTLNGKVYGDVLQMDDFLNALNGTLRLANSSVLFQPINLTVPIDLLDVQIDNNLAILNSLEIGIGEEDKINFSGRLENFGGFLSSTNTDQVDTFINLHSDRLQWDDFIDVFQKGTKKEQKDSVASINSRIKETLRELQTKFNPKLGIAIDRFEYLDWMVLEGFFAGLYFDGPNSLVLKESGFEYNEKSNVEFAAQLDISESAGTNVDVDVRAFGDPTQLNELLNYDTFLLEGGDLEITAKVIGDIENMNELISSATAMFKIENSAMVHNSSKVSIPFSVLEIDMLNDDAILKSMNIDLPSGDKIILEGQLNNITSILPEISGNYERMSSKLNIYSKKLRFSDFLDLFNTVDSVKKVKKTNRNLALKNVVKDFYNKYQPELSVKLDEFIFNKLIINNFNTGFYFENENLLYLENTAFDFYKGKVNLDAYLDITDPFETQFSLGFSTDNIDLEKLLISFDYFNIPSIREADKIDGKVSINTRLEGDLIDSTGIVSNSLRGTIGFDLQELEINGFEPIIKIGNIIFKKKRFEDIRFGSIENILYVANNTVEFPLMEVQSTALDFFVAGHLGFEDVPTSLWTAIPLSNFKNRDITKIPKKTEYIEAGKKIYIEAKSKDKDIDKTQYKLHLSEKKYFKERDSLSEYRIMMKENRLLRRKYKRDNKLE
ncbi:AsmA-like C-terminal region-containing protein [uncultured Eudoraea sp.]|uniref:AsmA-like C-terminal region-containing protein n=1 Tax=uncultured Eudoraea sp. TaxID=1035614 RepID=UPI0026082C4F|nr:AsmA-like C-terminal region-containing protein [uncultured Eudoraea sp.]